MPYTYRKIMPTHSIVVMDFCAADRKVLGVYEVRPRWRKGKPWCDLNSTGTRRVGAVSVPCRFTVDYQEIARQFSKLPYLFEEG